MTMTEIGRVKLPKLAQDGDEMSALMGDVRREALEVLGLVEANKKPTQAEDPRTPLAKALGDLDIEILDWRQVVTYKAEQKAKMEIAEARKIAAQDDAPPPGRTSAFAWQLDELKGYKGRVPDHVLVKAAQIKRVEPDVKFYVNHLENTPDPFLIATLHNLSPYDWQAYPHFYIEVWEEPDFERRF